LNFCDVVLPCRSVLDDQDALIMRHSRTELVKMKTATLDGCALYDNVRETCVTVGVVCFTECLSRSITVEAQGALVTLPARPFH